MQLRHVVTCFLSDSAQGTILLGQRSDHVSTYPGHWAAISGSVESGEPLEQAYQEIEEEAGLAPSQVALLSEGKPVRFTDWELGIAWVVHPFLFRCDEPELVRRDWEHVQFEWVQPSRIPEMETVPRLAQAHQSVRAVQGRPTSRWIFEQVRQDRQHGAEELGLSAMNKACREAVALRPSMAPVRSAALAVFGVCRDVLGSAEPGEAPAVVRARIGGLLAEREQAALAPACVAASLFPDGAAVVTLSCSFTVLSVLKEAADHIAGLTVAESRPACEGRETARLAATFGIPTELVTDAVAARAVEQADLVLLGADGLCADGSVVNKAGTFALCCAARAFGKESLCAATESKILPAGFEPLMEEMAPDELGQSIPGVGTRNVYFEQVPADLIGRIIVGSGDLQPGRLAGVAAELCDLQDALGCSE
ncbi:MAG: NUDIX domain-containing protein [Planctomycetota bacterium]|jgi:translation initiation factor 2B subunit (eIF-2B alpha/beta/delta family)/8-oxo-dGTP pyrophosphatase MutT (NUDIX family)